MVDANGLAKMSARFTKATIAVQLGRREMRAPKHADWFKARLSQLEATKASIMADLEALMNSPSPDITSINIHRAGAAGHAALEAVEAEIRRSKKANR